MPGLLCLRNIVHASPACHEAYLGAREDVLHVITTHILHQNGIGLLDPRTAVHAPQLGYDIDNRAEIITEFLERYHQGRMDGNPQRLALQDSLTILNLQSKIAILISEYCKAVFATNPLTESKDKDSLPPSQSELNRLYRAYWRYVIYSRLFAPINGDRHRVIDFDASVFDEIVMANKFLGLFPIHEVEELACLHKDAEILYRMQSEGEKQDEVVDQGPKQLYKALTAKSKQGRDARIDESGTYEILYIKMRTAFEAYNNNVSWVSWQWKGMDDKFASDRVPTTGWLWASSHGIQKVDYGLRRWGYVFWDRERLDSWKITAKNMVHLASWRSSSL